MNDRWTRRSVIKAAGAVGLAAVGRQSRGAERRVSEGPPPEATRREGDAIVAELSVAETELRIDGRRARAITLNGTLPGPLLRFQEGRTAVIRVTNRLDEDTSVHWHGLLVPPRMDGVPGISFPGIRPGETFEYRFPLRQYGTYWYHSHSGLQEQLGHLGPLIIDPAEGRPPFQYDREHFVVLSDWTFEDPYRVLSRLKKDAEYYNRQRQTVFDLFSDFGRKGFVPTMRDRLMWSGMRMDPTDLLDVNGATYTYLVNGTAPEDNWTGLFRPGERVLLHLINAAANTYFDVRIPGLAMTVVEGNGQWVQPVETDELRIAVAETYNVIVQPQDRAYTLFAESMDRSGYARGTLAPRPGMQAELPPRRPRPLLTMADMGMAHGEGGPHGGHGGPAATPAGDAGPGTDQGPPARRAGAGHGAHEPDAAPARAGASAPPAQDHAGGDSTQPPSGSAAESAHAASAHSGHDGAAPQVAPGAAQERPPGGGHAAHEPATQDDPSTSPHAGHDGAAKPQSTQGSAAQAPPASRHAGHDAGTPGDTTPGPAQGGAPAASDHGGHAPRAGGSALGDDVVVAGRVRTEGLRPPGTLPPPAGHEKNTHGPGNAAVPEQVRSRLDEPGIGLGGDGWRVLTYADLRALEQRAEFRAPTRELELHLTGNMERFMWSIDGIPFADARPVELDFGERLRLTLVNDTMMNHPMHLHGMWMELENGHRERIPRVHTINVKPAERLSLLIDVDAPGRWAFHCHLLYHMEVGMFRVFEVAQRREEGGHAH